MAKCVDTCWVCHLQSLCRCRSLMPSLWLTLSSIVYYHYCHGAAVMSQLAHCVDTHSPAVPSLAELSSQSHCAGETTCNLGSYLMASCFIYPAGAVTMCPRTSVITNYRYSQFKDDTREPYFISSVS